MDTQMITSLIGSLGFPIVMCFLMSYFIFQSLDKYSQIAQKVEITVENNNLLLKDIEELLNEKKG